MTLSSRLSFRTGVTLIELLVVVLIISILAALILGVAAVARETAHEATSRHVVQRLHTLLTEQLGTYKPRRVRLNPNFEKLIDGDNSLNASRKGQLKAEARLYALREMMLMEMPDRWSDVLLNRVPASSPGNATALQPIYLDATGSTMNSSFGRSQLGAAYLRRYFQIAKNTTTEKLIENQSAECLYMVITIACGDGEARTLFGEQSIGDTDGDGAPEFLDGWGHPIKFLRWAPGFDSQVQLNANLLGAPNSSSWTTAAAKDHDSFDTFRADQNAFRLMPLIYSPGRDEVYGIQDAGDYVKRDDYVAWTGVMDQRNVPRSPPPLRPCAQATDPLTNTQMYLGTAIDATATDNVHNHLLGLR